MQKIFAKIEEDDKLLQAYHKQKHVGEAEEMVLKRLTDSDKTLHVKEVDRIEVSRCLLSLT